MADAYAPLAELSRLVERDGVAVLVTVAAARGSVPRDAGTTMVVGRDTVMGTIGGGHLEFEAIRLSRGALAQEAAPPPWVVRFPLAARLGQCCGGVVTLAFEVVPAGVPWLAAIAEAERHGTPCTLMTRVTAHDKVTLLVQAPSLAWLQVTIFGNGHVGRALVPMLAAVPARVRWIDAREDDFPATLPDGVEVVVTDIPEAELAHAPPGACVLIATHDHALDFTLVTAALARSDWTYLGLIGSRSKRQQFERRLLARGFTQAQLDRIVCPIGRGEVHSLTGKEPGTIALATAAEIVAAHQRARAAERGDGVNPTRDAKHGNDESATHDAARDAHDPPRSGGAQAQRHRP